jgi:hypothetical protein
VYRNHVHWTHSSFLIVSSILLVKDFKLLLTKTPYLLQILLIECEFNFHLEINTWFGCKNDMNPFLLCIPILFRKRAWGDYIYYCFHQNNVFSTGSNIRLLPNQYDGSFWCFFDCKPITISFQNFIQKHLTSESAFGILRRIMRSWEPLSTLKPICTRI